MVHKALSSLIGGAGVVDASLDRAQQMLSDILRSPEDASNSLAAQAFDEVDEAATRHGSELKELVRDMQDIVVLSCCRSVGPASKERLLQSLTDAFGRDISNLISRLMHAREKMFGLSEQSGRRKRPAKKPGKRAATAGEVGG